MRKILEFIGANLFLLDSGAIGAGVMWIGGWVLRHTMDDPNSAGWPYAAVAAVAIAAMYFGTVWLWRFIDRRLRRNSERGRG